MNWSKINRITHRDIGYLIAGLTLIYAISGIALNHKHDWNANYIVDTYEFSPGMKIDRETFNDDIARSISRKVPGNPDYKAYHFPTGQNLTIFVDGGYIRVNTVTGKAVAERLSKRPVFYQVNFLHYNPGKWWKYFSDIFCVSLILVTITGLFIVKGKNGITRRGAILTATGIILPLLFLFIY